MDALQMFYSADELSIVLQEVGFSDVRAKTVLAGTVAYHSAIRASSRFPSTPRHAAISPRTLKAARFAVTASRRAR